MKLKPSEQWLGLQSSTIIGWKRQCWAWWKSANSGRMNKLWDLQLSIKQYPPSCMQLWLALTLLHIKQSLNKTWIIIESLFQSWNSQQNDERCHSLEAIPLFLVGEDLSCLGHSPFPSSMLEQASHLRNKAAESPAYSRRMNKLSDLQLSSVSSILLLVVRCGTYIAKLVAIILRNNLWLKLE